MSNQLYSILLVCIAKLHGDKIALHSIPFHCNPYTFHWLETPSFYGQESYSSLMRCLAINKRDRWMDRGKVMPW